MQLVSFLFLFATTSEFASGYNVNHEQSTVYKKAIAKTMHKQPDIVPVKNSAPAIIPLSRIRSAVKTREKLAGPPNYWFHPQIHTFGNTGVLGAIHAALAPLATLLIDVAAYKGENIRVTIGRELRQKVGKTGANVVDLCCGVGISTRALRKSFGDANNIIGVDTSPEMIAMAEVLAEDNVVAKLMKSYDPTLTGACDASYSIGNAECTNLPKGSFDLVTIMYGFHEVPFLGRYRILREARRLLAPGGTLAIVDISTEYEPSPTMLAGEPYVLEYQKNIHAQLNALQGFDDCTYVNSVPGHVGTWFLTRKEASFPVDMLGEAFVREPAKELAHLRP